MDLTVIKEGLRKDGFTVTDNPNGSVNFAYEGGNYYIDMDPADDKYVRVGFPELWIIQSTGQHLAALEISSKVSESMKAVKVYVHNSTVHCTVEQFVTSEDFLQTYRRYLAAIQGAVRRFVDMMVAHPQVHSVAKEK